MWWPTLQRGLTIMTSDERWMFWAISCTFLFYFLGALYLVAPALGWLLIARLLIVSVFTVQPSAARSTWIAVLWGLSAFGLLLALVVGHLSFDLGFGKIIKSIVGWAKGWALLVVFVWLGIYSTIRAEVLVRAACVVGLIALLISPFLIVAWLVGAPGFLYVSPLKVLGGSGPEYFTVILYEIDPGNGAPRWRYFAPWAPAVGFVANLYLLCAFFEKDPFWRWVGLAGSALMIVLAASRMGIIVMLFVPLAIFFLSRLAQLWVVVVAVLLILLIAFNFEWLWFAIDSMFTQIKEARADSTRVRSTLNEIAIYRWHTEAFWFGHGVVEPGSHLVEFMPIGTHHNWYGLLFVKGVVGFVSFALPFIVTGIALVLRAQVSWQAQLAMGLFFVLAFFSLSENIEALAYLTWPAWLLIGVALREPLQNLRWENLMRLNTRIFDVKISGEKCYV